MVRKSLDSVEDTTFKNLHAVPRGGSKLYMLESTRFVLVPLLAQKQKIAWRKAVRHNYFPLARANYSFKVLPSFKATDPPKKVINK